MRSFFVYSLILMVQSLTKSCPRVRGKCRGVSRDERGTAWKCKMARDVPPQSAYADSSPASGGAFWCSINSIQKAPLYGELASRRRD